MSTMSSDTIQLVKNSLIQSSFLICV